MGNIDELKDDSLEARIEHIGHEERVLKLGATGQHETKNIGAVVGDEVLSGSLSDLAEVVVATLHTDTGETILRLTTTTVLLGELNGEGAELLLDRSANGRVHATSTVNNDEAELLVGLEHTVELLGVELVVAEIQVTADGLEGLNVESELLLLAVLSQNGAGEEHETVRGDTVDELQAAERSSNSTLDRELVSVRLDVGRGTKLIVEHSNGVGNLILRGNVNSNDGSADTASSLEHLNELLDLVALNILLSLIHVIHGSEVVGGGVNDLNVWFAHFADSCLSLS